MHILMSNRRSGISKMWKSMYEVILASFFTLVNRCYVHVVSFYCIDRVVYFLTLSRLW